MSTADELKATITARLTELDEERERLQRALAALDGQRVASTGSDTPTKPAPRRRGRPRRTAAPEPVAAANGADATPETTPTRKRRASAGSGRGSKRAPRGSIPASILAVATSEPQTVSELAAAAGKPAPDAYAPVRGLVEAGKLALVEGDGPKRYRLA